MAYIIFLCLGGFYNLYNFRDKISHRSDEDMPYKNSGYFAAFIGGALIYGLAMCFLYWIFN